MNKELKKIEQIIIHEIAVFNERDFPLIKKCIPHLKVKSRENTGVGMYISFEDLPDRVTALSIGEDIALSSNKILVVDELKFGLNYELNITNGKIDYLELVTNGEDWEGNFKGAHFV